MLITLRTGPSESSEAGVVAIGGSPGDDGGGRGAPPWTAGD